jgi:hypothetical protein
MERGAAHARERETMIRRWSRISACVAVLLALLAAGEWGLRRGGYAYTRLAQRALDVRNDLEKTLVPNADLYRIDARELWSPRPGAILPWTNGERINPDGYRGPQLDVERKKGVLRIAYLGGATTFGVGVRYEDSFPALATRLIGERTMPAECLNAGVEGFSIRQCLERYRDLVRPYRPHVVVLSISPAVCYQQAAEGWTDDQRIRCAQSVDEAKKAAHWPKLRILQFAYWVSDALGGRYWAERDFEFQQMRLEKGSGELDWPGARRVPVDDYYHSLSWLLQETRQDGAHLVLISIPKAPGVYIPPVHDVYQQVVNEFADREKLLLLDGRNAYLAALRDDIPKEDLFQSDQYASECGHLQLAEALAQEIVRGISAKSSPRAGPGAGAADKR